MRSVIASIAPSPPLGGEGWGEGGFDVSSQRYQDCSDNALRIGHDVGICEPQDAIAQPLQVFGSRLVICFGAGMGIAVHLNDQALRSCSEISNVRSNNDLALELHTQSIGPEQVPQPSLRFGEICSEFLRSGACFDVPLHASYSPLSQPSPPKGGEGFRYAA
jgi:hypothetical protein